MTNVKKLFVSCEDFSAIGSGVLASWVELVPPRRYQSGPPC
jgi:hypothetical protein